MGVNYLAGPESKVLTGFYKGKRGLTKNNPANLSFLSQAKLGMSLGSTLLPFPVTGIPSLDAQGHLLRATESTTENRHKRGDELIQAAQRTDIRPARTAGLLTAQEGCPERALGLLLRKRQGGFWLWQKQNFKGNPAVQLQRPPVRPINTHHCLSKQSFSAGYFVKWALNLTLKQPLPQRDWGGGKGKGCPGFETGILVEKKTLTRVKFIPDLFLMGKRDGKTIPEKNKLANLQYC